MSSTRNYFWEEKHEDIKVDESNENKMRKPEELKHAIKLEWKFGEKSF